MNLAVSPYFLTTREPPVMAAFLLAERVITLIPAPAARESADDLHRAARTTPRYLDMMESWRWSMPLWTSGVIASAWSGDDPAADVHRAAVRIAEDPGFESLHAFMNDRLFESEGSYLDLLARDVLKGGPDPGICIPVHAGLDAFAARHGLVVARAAAVSLAQQAEDRWLEPLARIAIPVLLQAPAESLLLARELLESKRRNLLEALAAGGRSPALGEAAAAYTAAFDSHLQAMRAAGPVDDVRVVHGTAAITFARLPVEAVLRSSLYAAATARRGPRAGLPSVRSNSAPARSDSALATASSDSVYTLVVRVLGRTR